MRKIILSATLSLALLLMATLNLHAASGTYIDCMHGCPDLIVCTNCCNETFSSILATCKAKWDQCDSLCPPGNMGCLDECIFAISECLMQDMRDFDCPEWTEVAPRSRLSKSVLICPFIYFKDVCFEI
ncbi:hypothetical protein [Desulfonatronum parangueonense]